MIRNNRILLWLFLVAIIFFSTGADSVLADFALRDWRYAKDVILPSRLDKESLVEIVPDGEVFAGSQISLTDLRIVAGSDTEVPYKLEVSRAERNQTFSPISIRDNSYLSGQYNSFVADLGRAGILHNQIEFQTSSTDFRRTATVEASQDGSTWAELGRQTVYGFTVRERSFSTRNTRLAYPDSTARYLRVKIADEGEGSLQINGASVFYLKETPAREVQWPASLSGTSRDAERKATFVDIDLGTANVPSYRVTIRVPDVNFHRVVALETSSDREKWRTVLSQSEIYSYDTPKFVGSSLTITYQETASRYLRLTIYDEDSPPLTVQGVDVWALRRRVVFSASSQFSYRLFYGNTEAGRPSYDIERVFPYLVTETLPEARLGPQAPNLGFIEKKLPLPPLTERLPWLLPAVIGVAVFLGSLLLLAIMRQARMVLPPPPQ